MQTPNHPTPAQNKHQTRSEIPQFEKTLLILLTTIPVFMFVGAFLFDFILERCTNDDDSDCSIEFEVNEIAIQDPAGVVQRTKQYHY